MVPLLKTLRSAALLCLALTVLAPAPAAAQPPQPASCSTVAQNLYVRDVMADIYLWYREIPRLDPATFASPEAYLDAIRYQPLDASFSYIASRAETEAFFSDSQFVGFGFTLALTAQGELRLAEVFPGSPAQAANLARGDRLVTIGGRAVASLLDSGEIFDAFGPDQVGVEVSFEVSRDSGLFAARVAQALVTIPTVSLTQVLTADNRRVGYLSFRNFVEPSFAALDAAFADLRARGVDELVLDLRYNGGGLVDVAQHLASLIGGARTNGATFTEFFHNDRHPELNEVLRFEPKTNALTLQRVIVITTFASASASELVINGLKPFMPVVVVGERTYGKPVGQYGVTFCDKVLAPVAFSLRNADGQGDFFDGIPATCAAADDLTRPLGDPQEASLREALTVVRTGRCSDGRSLATTRRTAAPRTSLPASAWGSILNAH